VSTVALPPMGIWLLSGEVLATRLDSEPVLMAVVEKQGVWSLEIERMAVTFGVTRVPIFGVLKVLFS
jgi:hypothetical protein